MLSLLSFFAPYLGPNKLFENTDKMGHAFLEVLYPVLKYFTIIKVEK